MGILQSFLYFSSVAVPPPRSCSEAKPRTSTSTMGFVMPLHYPRYSKEDYEAMPEDVLDRLLASYGLPVGGDFKGKREEAMGHFLWPSQRGCAAV